MFARIPFNGGNNNKVTGACEKGRDPVGGETGDGNRTAYSCYLREKEVRPEREQRERDRDR